MRARIGNGSALPIEGAGGSGGDELSGSPHADVNASYLE
jgi:hypothetical protein